MSNALVPVVHAREEPLVPGGRPANADFVAHLIATAAGLPQTRARRRAEPGEAIAAYGAVGHRPTERGQRLFHSC